MANRILENVASFSGIYNSVAFADSKSSEVEITLVDPKVTKTANQQMWFSGELTFTITVDNTSGLGPIENLVITDALDETMFGFISGSVVVTKNGTALVSPDDYTAVYTPGTPTGTLTITIVAPILSNEVVIITFRGTKVAA